jgi:hypothetical protein
MPQPASAREGDLTGSPACGPVSEGQQWGQLDGRRRSPGTPGRLMRLGERSFTPSGFTYIHSAPPGACGPGAVVPSGGPAARAPIRY